MGNALLPIGALFVGVLVGVFIRAVHASRCRWRRCHAQLRCPIHDAGAIDTVQAQGGRKRVYT